MKKNNNIYHNLIEQVRTINPLVHHITNYVTVNDCANITLAIGASPIMADDINEAEDITVISSALVINMGTLNERTVLSMIASGKKANQKGIPVIFDPVGAGASKFRNETASQLLNEIKFTVICGNISEIKFLSGLQSETKGVDASDADMVATENTKTIAFNLAQKLQCVVAITGKTDVVSDGKKTIYVENGHPMLSTITGTGCMCSSLIGSFCGAAPNYPLESTVTALLTMGIAGEMAYDYAKDYGNGSFRMALHNAMSHMDEEILVRRAKYIEALH